MYSVHCLCILCNVLCKCVLDCCHRVPNPIAVKILIINKAIRQKIRPIDRQLLARVMDEFKKRLENCIQEDGRHLTDIIFKT